MKAIDFIRKFGWKEAKLFVDENISAGDVYDNIDDNYFYVETNWTELKQYVDAYELVQSYGGLDKSKELSCSNNVIFNVHPLRKAITLVEEVGECDE